VSDCDQIVVRTTSVAPFAVSCVAMLEVWGLGDSPRQLTPRSGAPPRRMDDKNVFTSSMANMAAAK